MSLVAKPSLAIAALVSGQGRGTNVQALLDACASGEIPAHMAVVIGTRTDAPALDRARAMQVPTAVVSPRKYEGDETAYGQTLCAILARYDIGLICLAGYLLRLPSPVVETYSGRIMNVHPALLPLFGGRGMYGERVHQAVIASGMKVSGCTVHFVDEQYDTGPIILQTAVPVEEDDDAHTLAARILPHEHRTYVRAVRLFAEGKLHVQGRRVFVEPHTESSQL